MNDKIELHFKPDNFKIKPNNNLEYDTTYDKDGNLKRIKEYYNHLSADGNEKFNLDIDSRGLLLKCNPNKFSKHNFVTGGFLDYSKFKQVTENIEQIINDEAGVELTFNKASISRYDNSFDIQATNDYKKCKKVLKEICDGNTGAQRNANDFMIKDTLYYGNNSEKIVVYDKSKEIYGKKDYYSYLSEVPENLIRFEHRRLKNKNNRRILFSSMNEQKYHTIRCASINNINKRLFSVDVQANKLGNYLFDAFNSDNVNLTEVRKHMTNIAIIQSDYNLSFLTLPRYHKNYQKLNRFKQEQRKHIIMNSKLISDIYNDIKNKFNLVTK